MKQYFYIVSFPLGGTDKPLCKGFLDYVHCWKILSYKKAHTCDLRLVRYLFHRESKILNEISTLHGWPQSANHLVQSKNVCFEASD